MKSLIILFGLIVYSFTAQAQTISVPDVVKAKFASLYPAVKNPQWELENSMYEASFQQNNFETAVLISAAGELVKTENGIEPNTLPRFTRHYVMTELANKPVTSAAKIVDTQGKVSYEAEVGGVDYLFDADGHFTGIDTDVDDEKGEKD